MIKHLGNVLYVFDSKRMTEYLSIIVEFGKMYERHGYSLLACNDSQALLALEAGAFSFAVLDSDVSKRRGVSAKLKERKIPYKVSYFDLPDSRRPVPSRIESPQNTGDLKND